MYGVSISFINSGNFSFFKKKNWVGFLFFVAGFYFDSLDFL